LRQDARTLADGVCIKDLTLLERWRSQFLWGQSHLDRIRGSGANVVISEFDIDQGLSTVHKVFIDALEVSEFRRFRRMHLVGPLEVKQLLTGLRDGDSSSLSHIPGTGREQVICLYRQ